jgi:hypothetical protein
MSMAVCPPSSSLDGENKEKQGPEDNGNRGAPENGKS